MSDTRNLIFYPVAHAPVPGLSHDVSFTHNETGFAALAYLKETPFLFLARESESGIPSDGDIGLIGSTSDFQEYPAGSEAIPKTLVRMTGLALGRIRSVVETEPLIIVEIEHEEDSFSDTEQFRIDYETAKPKMLSLLTKHWLKTTEKIDNPEKVAAGIIGMDTLLSPAQLEVCNPYSLLFANLIFQLEIRDDEVIEHFLGGGLPRDRFFAFLQYLSNLPDAPADGIAAAKDLVAQMMNDDIEYGRLDRLDMNDPEVLDFMLESFPKLPERAQWWLVKAFGRAKSRFLEIQAILISMLQTKDSSARLSAMEALMELSKTFPSAALDASSVLHSDELFIIAQFFNQAGKVGDQAEIANVVLKFIQLAPTVSSSLEILGKLGSPHVSKLQRENPQPNYDTCEYYDAFDILTFAVKACPEFKSKQLELIPALKALLTLPSDRFTGWAKESLTRMGVLQAD